MSFLEAPREGHSSFGRYGAGLGTIVLLYVLLSIVVVLILFGVAGEGGDPSEIPILPLGPAAPAATIGLLLLPSVAVLLGVVAVVRLLHGRPAASLVRSDRRPRWRRAWLGAAVWTGAAAAFELVAWLLYPQSYSWSFDPARFLPLLAVAVLLVPLQSAAEELLFRGYLMQALGLALRRGWAALIVSSIAFGLVHAGNPELQRFGRGFLLYYVFIGLALGLATLLDDGLEVAIGAHTANNLWGALVVSFPGSVLDTPALLRMEGVPPEVMAALGVGVALTSLLVLGILLDWRRRWRALGPLQLEHAAPATPALEER